MIEFINVTKTFGPEKTIAVDNLSCSLMGQETTVLVGPSGCGKTTTLRMINRLTDPSHGDIKLNDESILKANPVELRRRIGYVIQETGLFPHLTIYENIAVVPRLLKWTEDRINKRADELLDLINLEPPLFRERYPMQLSGGQRQRVGVVRALAADPDILLMDEPFGAVDPINREILQDAFLEIQESLRKTIVMVTHDVREAVKMGDRILILDHGKVIQCAPTTEVVTNPANPFVEDLLGADRALYSLETLGIRQIISNDYFTATENELLNPQPLLKRMKERQFRYCFVIDSNGRLMGYINRKSVENSEGGEDCEIKPIESLHANANLREAIIHVITSGVAALPVTDAKGHLRGVLHLRDALDHIEEEKLEESDSEVNSQ